MRKSFFPELTRACWLALAVLCGCQTGSADPATGGKSQPNIVYILTDDLGYGDVDALNPFGKIKTPSLDRLAADGMRFTEAHSSSAVCTPSRYNILTGRYNWRSTLKSGVLGGFSKPLIEPGRLTVAELLRRQGYRTAYVGKWHLGLEWPRKAGAAASMESGENEENHDHTAPPRNPAAGIDFSKPIGRAPTPPGFHEFSGISAALDLPPYAYTAPARATAEPSIAGGFLEGRAGKRTRIGPRAPGFNAEDVLPTFTKRAVGYIDRHAKAARGGKPFFLYVAFPTPHTPIAPTVAWQGKS